MIHIAGEGGGESDFLKISFSVYIVLVFFGGGWGAQYHFSQLSPLDLFLVFV